MKQQKISLNEDEMRIVRDALIEYWINNMWKAKESKFKAMARYLKDEFKEKCTQQKF